MRKRILVLMLMAVCAYAADIHQAAYTGDLDRVKNLIKEDPGQVHAPDEQQGAAPLHYAATAGNLEICKYLIEQGARIDQKDTQGMSPLHSAAVGGRVEVAAYFLDAGADVCCRNARGASPIHLAAWAGYGQIIEMLARGGGDPNAEDQDGITPLFYAVSGKHTDSIDALVRAGGDLAARGNYQSTLLHSAAARGNPAMIDCLIEKNLDIEAADEFGNTPLMFAVLMNNADHVKLLLSHGADWSHANNSGETPLLASVLQSRGELVDVFLENGADINTSTQMGDTPLHTVAYMGDEAMTRKLMEKGANVNLKNNHQVTPLDLALERHHEGVAELIRAQGGKRGKEKKENPDLPLPMDTPGPGLQKSVHVTIIYDNYIHTEGMEADWGFSCLVEGPEKTILFDTGTNPDLFERNFKRLKLNPKKVDMVVLSHEHGDHTGGLFRFLEWKHDLPVLMPYSFSYPFVRRVEAAGAEPVTVLEPGRICKDVYLSGELGDRIKEHCLILNTTHGLVVITGCSHPGIVSMLQHIRSTLDKPIYMVFGGFHLMNATDEQMADIIQSFRDMGVKKVGATHCTGDHQIELFRQAYQDDYVSMGAGNVIVF